ncbi:ankyrin repeat domain-containing protein [Litoreibacter roseus]|uniref:Uncharacterized protein n=1 Tax=Litoreibacter roseus TaxID=2601869 RepID=A0A6N6JK65_9RHOB|nr:ankyrin repeat domain-containing protein [Litoreibacter roseus]GFE65819.1 hypothetical protein KIN_28930 [Litoreibacter roseus]
MSKKLKNRATLEDILASCADSFFPAHPVKIDSRRPDGDTPLHVMLWQENAYAALELIKAGADVNAAGDMGETPLHIAVKKQNLSVIEALIDAGADSMFKSELGQSPKDLAIAQGGDVARFFTDR